MKKVSNLFGFVFLGIVFVCSIPTIVRSVFWQKEYCQQEYDDLLQRYNTRYYKPADPALESGYLERKKILANKFPVKDRISAGRKFNKFVNALWEEKKDFEDQLFNSFPFRMIFSEISMAFRKFIGMKIPIEYSRHYLRPDGSLGFLPANDGKFYPLRSISNVKTAAEKVNAKFHVVVRPENCMDDNSEIYLGLRDPSNSLIDTRVRQLEHSGISVWDMRTPWNRLPNRSRYFFRTDHHWNVYGALKGAEILASILNENYQLDYDIGKFNPDSFLKIRLENVYLGSSGKILTAEYADNSEAEDFEMLFPAYETDFTLRHSKKYCDRGDFSIFLFTRYWTFDIYKYNLYVFWLDGDMPEVRIINHRIPKEKGKKLLFIKDSFSDSLLPYLALQTREIVMVDPRGRNETAIQKIIQREKPDFVFWIYSLILPLKWI